MKSFQSITKYMVALLTAGVLLISCKNNVTLNVESGSGSVKVGGYVVGLDTPGEQVTLRLGAETINVNYVNGYDSFSFMTRLTTGQAYLVELVGQTTLKTCDLGGNAGKAGTSDINSVTVNCHSLTAGSPGITVFPVAAVTTNEGGATASFAIWLNAAPTANVSIGISSSDLTEGTVSTASLLFTTGTWSTPQLITVTGQNDWVQDGNFGFSVITSAAVSTDINYSGINPPDVTVTNLDNDTSGVYITPTTGLMVTESAGSGHTNSFSVVLTAAPIPLTTVTIPLSSSNVAEGTVTPASLVFDDSNWNIPQTVTGTGVDNAIADGNQIFSIVTGNASSFDPWYSGMVISDVTFTKIDNETPGVTVLAGSSMLVSESGTTSAFSVVLNSQPTANVTIALNTSSSLEGIIALPAVPNLTFTNANWNIPQTVTVQGVSDSIADGNQPFNIVIAAAVSGDGNYNGVNPPDVSFTNVDMDTAGVIVNKGVGSLVTSEAGTTASFSIVLQSKPTATVTVDPTILDTSEGLFTVPFAGATGTLTFTTGNWNIPQTVTIQGQNDALADGNISYNINFSAPSSADIVYNGNFTPALITVMNIDNDAAGITVSAGSTMEVSESGTTSSFTVVLNSLPTANVTIGINTTNALEGTITAPFAGASGTLTFTSANWSTSQTVTVQGVPDFVADGNQTFFIVLAAAVSTDVSYNGVNPPDVTYINVDRNTAGVTVLAGANMLVSESQTTSVFTVVLNSQPAADVTVPVSTSNALEGTITTPFVGSTGTLTFTSANWNIPQFVTVKGVPDSVADGNQNFNIVLGLTTSVDGLYNNLNPSDVSFMNADIDTAGVIVNKGVASLVTSETGTTTSFSVVLQSMPTANVTISPTIAIPAEGTFTAPFVGSTGTLTFTTGNWNIPQTVTVQGVDEFIRDGNTVYNINFGATASTDGTYNGTFTPAFVSVINVDNETSGITVNTGTGLITTEAGGTATIWIVLNSQPTANVIVGNTGNITSSDLTEVTVSSATLTFTNFNWSVPQPVTLTGVDDALTDGLIASIISFGTSSSGDLYYNNLTPGSVSTYNSDNETGVVPIDLAVSTPYVDNATSASGKRYHFAGLAGTNYTFSVTGITADVNLFVFTNPGFTAVGCTSVNTGLTSESCSWSGFTDYYIIVQNITGSTANFSVKVSPPASNEGTTGAPIGVIVGTPYNGQVAIGGNSYYSVPVSANYAYYAISLNGLTSNQNLYVYTNAAFTTPAIPGASLNSGTVSEALTYNTTAGQTILYINVNDAGGTGGFFTLNVTQAIPTAITAGSTYNGLIPVNNAAGNGNALYYSVPVLASTAYATTLTNLNYNFDLYVYTDAAFSTLAGSSVLTGLSNELVNYTTTAGQTILYVKVLDKNGTGTQAFNSFGLKLIQGGYINQGTTGAPIALTVGTSYSGTVAAGGTGESCWPVNGTGNSYYSYPVTNGVNYTFSLTSLTDDFDLCVYAVAFSASPVASSLNLGPYVNELTTWTTTVTTVYVRVLNYSTNAGSFVLKAIPTANIVNQGTAGAPIGITVGTLYSGTVGSSGNSFFSVPVSANTFYTISLSDISQDFDLYVYTSIGNTPPVAGWVLRPYVGGTFNEIGTYTTGPAETMLYIAINDFSALGGLFNLKVQ